MSRVAAAVAFIACAPEPLARSADGGPAVRTVQVPLHGLSFSDVAARVTPSVVSITSERPASRLGSPFFGHEPLHDFFGPETHAEPMPPGVGSGFIVDDSGLVLTNSHVVDDASAIYVTLADGRELEATVVGADSKSDVAVIRLEAAADLQPLSFGDSASVRLGDPVLAVGNPFDVGQTVTMGIISAKGRADLGIVDYEDFIQTDAAINPGNSGGPLVNMAGQVIGINTAILSRTGSSIGIGFAIPSNMARQIMTSLVERGRVVRGWIGVIIQDVGRDLAEGLQLPVEDGVLVSDTASGGPAARAGVKRGDVIVGVDDQAITSTGQLRNIVASAGAGTRIDLDVVRDGKRRRLQVELGELPGPPREPRAPRQEEQRGLMGLEIAPLDPGARLRLRLPKEMRGVLVTGVMPGSAAARAGVQPGDVVLEVDREAIGSPQDFVGKVGSKKPVVVLLLRRGGTTLYAALRR